MDRNFEILINPDLIINFTDPGYYDRRRSLSGRVRKPKPAPNQVRQQRRHGPEEPWHPSPPPPPPPAVPASVHPPREVIKELEPLHQTVVECERVLDTLHTQDSTAREEAQRRAQELHHRQYRVNQPKPFRCSGVRQACLRCYLENPMDSLKCADSVRAYAECAQQVRECFATTGFS